MSPEETHEKVSALVDGTLPPEEEARMRQVLNEHPEIRAEYDELLAIRSSLRDVFTPPPVSDDEWEQVALRAVSRHGQRFGWVLFTPGILSLAIGALVAFFLNGGIPLWQRIAVGGVTCGLAFLLLSALADRLRARRRERYDKVNQ